MKKGLIYIIFFAFICCASNYAINYSMAQQIAARSPYSLSFASIGAISLASRLDCWAKLDSEYSKEEMRKKLQSILYCLDLPMDKNKMIFSQQDAITILQYNISANKLNYHFMIKADTKNNQTHFLTTILSYGEQPNLADKESRLATIPDLEWQYYYCYSGRLKEAVATNSQNELIRMVLKKLKAKPVNKYQDNHMTVVTAYSPAISTAPVKVGKYHCNLQTSIRNDKITGKCYITIGSPLILGEY